MTERDRATTATDALTGPVLRQIGHHLRQAREERGETLADIAGFLRIRRAYLEDLENGDLSAIPGRAYALGFLRSYGDYLGFNGDAIVEEVKRTDEPLPESPSLHVPEPLPESHRPPLALVAASLLMAALVYVGWQYWHDSREAPAQLAALDRPASAGTGVDAPPGDVEATPADAPSALPPARRATPPRDDVAAAAAAEEDGDEGALPPLPAIPDPPMPASVDALDDSTEITAAATAPADDAAVDAILAEPEAGRADAAPDDAAPDDVAATTEAAATPPEAVDLRAVVAAEGGAGELRTFGDDAAASRVVLVASAPSWVQVKSTSSDFVWTRTLEPGDAYFVPDREDLALWTGNAGGLKVVVDGKPLAPLGDRGQVRRDIPLAADVLSAQYPRN